MRTHIPSVVVLAIVVLSAAFQAWFLGLRPGALRFRESGGLLDREYTRALAHGYPYLLAPSDPRHPAKLRPLASSVVVLDTSPYQGRQYLYFSAIPFLALLVPWFMLTGTYLPASAAILAFSVLGYLAYGSMLLQVGRRFGGNRAFATGLAFAGLIAGSGTWPLMARPAIYEIENAAAFAFLGWAFFFLLQAELAVGGRRTLAAAAALVGLALGCRPNYFPAVAVVAAYILWRGRPASGGPAKRLGQAAILLFPLALVGLGLAWWNFVRFGSPWDFGAKAFSGTNKDSGLLRTSVAYVPYYAHRYLLGAARLGRYFPFVQGEKPGPLALASGQQPSNEVYGCLLFSPLVLWALLWPGARRAFRPARLTALAAVLVLAGAGNLLYLSLISFACYRYPADFLGPLVFLGSLAALGLCAAGSAWRRRLAHLALGLTALWSLLWALFITSSVSQIQNLFDRERPEDFARLAKPFDAAAYFLERAEHGGPTYLSLELRFPRDKYGTDEPLLVSGMEGAQDFLYAYYTAPGWIQFGFESMGRGGPVTRPIAVDYGAPHRLDIFFGSFLPPDDHPLLRGLSPERLAGARRSVQVRLDGKVVLDQAAAPHPVRARLFVGASPDDAAFGRKFSGQIMAVTHPLIGRAGGALDFSF